MSKVALVTGTSTGIGLSTSVALARAGFTVVATMRDTSKSDELLQRAQDEGVKLDVQRLEVTDPDSINACAAGVLTRHETIDLLVNNAGFGHLGTVEQTAIEDARRIMEVNFFGVWNMIRAVLPAMRKQGGGHIISLSSVGGMVGQPFNDAYCASKFAIEGLHESLAPVLREFGISVSLIEPGPVNTSFVNTVMPSAMALMGAADDPYLPTLQRYLGAMQKVFPSIGQTGDDVAGVIVEAATAAKPHLRYQTSPLARAVAERKLADPDGDSVLEITEARIAAAST